MALSDPVESHPKRDAVEQLTGAHHEGRAVGPIGKAPLVAGDDEIRA
jgi:hypothetical protein